MAWAMSTVNNPTANIETKRRALAMLRSKVDAHLQQSGQNLTAMGGTAVKVEAPTAGVTGAPAAAAGGDDAAARAWLAANPNDPRAEAVRKKLGGQ
jgi:hypothetical protein